MPRSCHNADFAYEPDTPILRALSVSFAPRRFAAIIGPNGAGKTTLLKLLLGVLTPTRGTVTLGSSPVSSLSPGERAARLAYIPQRSSLAFSFSVREVVRMGLFALPHADLRPAMERAGVWDRRDDSLGVLSAGQQQRATLARALAQAHAQPTTHERFLLADEPVSAMDPRHALECMTILRELADSGPGVVAVLHDLALVERFADDCLALDSGGQVSSFGPIREVLTPARLASLYSIPFRPLAAPEAPDRPLAWVPGGGPRTLSP